MADFRKWLIAFAGAALILGGTSVSAQSISGSTPFVCSASGIGALPPTVRAEGQTELVGDVVLNCTGGTPTAAGATIPTYNVQVFLNTNITSRVINSSGLTEALLMIDDPNPTTSNPIAAKTISPIIGQNLCGGSPAGMVGTVAPGTDTPATYVSPYNAAASGGPGCNVFEGQIQSTGGTGSNSVVWLGVPIDAPGTLTTRIVRITNIRANAAALGVSSTFIPTQLFELLSITGASNSITTPQSISITNPQFTVGFILPGLKSNVGTATLAQCTSLNTLFLSSSGTGTAETFTVKITEGFASAFKPRTYPFVGGVLPTTTTFPTPQIQNVEGFAYNSESGFYNPAVTGNVVGLADTGTRLQVAFAAVNNGVSLFVPNVVPLTGGAGGFLVLVSPTMGSAAAITPSTVTPGGLGNTSSTGLTVTGGVATAVYEVIYADPAAVETATIPVSVAFTSNTGQNLPALTGTTPATVAVSFNPVYVPPAGTTADSTSAVPRFIGTPTPSNSFGINACTCNLLFPFVTNQAGFDTGIAIANTSVDPFGTSPQHGPVTLNFYGSGVNGAAAPAAITTADVAGGTVFAFTLSGGVSGSTTTTAGFQGYVIATAAFQFCHGFAYVSQAGNPFGGGAEGYVALEMDAPFGSRTGNFGEVLGH